MGKDTDHATYSASGSAKWLSCPGSIALCAKAPEAPESKYAEEGTQAHACLEFLLKNRFNSVQAMRVALRTYSQEMVEHAVEAVTWILERSGELKDSEILCEQKVDSSPFLCEGQFGTLDAAIVQEFGTLVIADYKYGMGVAVEPEGEDDLGNSQLVYYALALSHKYHHNFANVELVVIQPRAFHESGNTTRSHTLTMEQLLAWEPVFKAGVAATLKTDAPLNTGKWCRWCNAATICPKLKSEAMAQATIVFADETGVESVPEPKLITLPHLGTVLDACDKLEAWIGKVREHAVHVLERGQEVDGFKLVAKRSPRRWTNADDAKVEAVKKFGKAALSEPKLLSPAQLEKAAKGASGLDEWVSARTTSESSGTTLVRASDKRPAVRTLDAVFAEPHVAQIESLPAELFGKKSARRK